MNAQKVRQVYRWGLAAFVALALIVFIPLALWTDTWGWVFLLPIAGIALWSLVFAVLGRGRVEAGE